VPFISLNPKDVDVALLCAPPTVTDQFVLAGRPLSVKVTGKFFWDVADGTTMVLDCMVTPPVRARARPSKVAPVSREMDVIAMIVPWNTEVVPSVAELPTCQ
jgi:hypothetical protein